MGTAVGKVALVNMPSIQSSRIHATLCVDNHQSDSALLRLGEYLQQIENILFVLTIGKSRPSPPRPVSPLPGCTLWLVPIAPVHSGRDRNFLCMDAEHDPDRRGTAAAGGSKLGHHVF